MGGHGEAKHRSVKVIFYGRHLAIEQWDEDGVEVQVFEVFDLAKVEGRVRAIMLDLAGAAMREA